MNLIRINHFYEALFNAIKNDQNIVNSVSSTYQIMPKHYSLPFAWFYIQNYIPQITNSSSIANVTFSLEVHGYSINSVMQIAEYVENIIYDFKYKEDGFKIKKNRNQTRIKQSDHDKVMCASNFYMFTKITNSS